MRIQIINGPNLNLLGRREPSIYGTKTFDDFFDNLQTLYPDMELFYEQSNVEGELIDIIQRVGFSFDGIILNAGAYTHTSIALHDCIKAISTPVIEVHISNTQSRESFRHISMIGSVCKGSIAGFGLDSYRLAIEALIAIDAKEHNEEIY